MVKGVHKKIIEVNHTDSDYFEKAVFYLRSDVSQLPPQVAEAAAQMLFQENGWLGRKKSRARMKKWLLTGGAVLSLLAVVVLLFQIC